MKTNVSSEARFITSCSSVWSERRRQKKAQNLCRPDCLQFLSVQYSSSLLTSEKGPDAEKSQWRSSCGLVSVSGTKGFRSVPV